MNEPPDSRPGFGEPCAECHGTGVHVQQVSDVALATWVHPLDGGEPMIYSSAFAGTMVPVRFALCRCVRDLLESVQERVNPRFGQ